MEGFSYDWTPAFTAGVDVALAALADHRVGSVAVVLALALAIAVMGVLPDKPVRR